MPTQEMKAEGRVQVFDDTVDKSVPSSRIATQDKPWSLSKEKGETTQSTVAATTPQCNHPKPRSTIKLRSIYLAITRDETESPIKLKWERRLGRSFNPRNKIQEGALNRKPRLVNLTTFATRPTFDEIMEFLSISEADNRHCFPVIALFDRESISAWNVLGYLARLLLSIILQNSYSLSHSEDFLSHV